MRSLEQARRQAGQHAQMTARRLCSPALSLLLAAACLLHAATGQVIVFQTNLGDISFELFPEVSAHRSLSRPELLLSSDPAHRRPRSHQHTSSSLPSWGLITPTTSSGAHTAPVLLAADPQMRCMHQQLPARRVDKGFVAQTSDVLQRRVPLDARQQAGLQLKPVLAAFLMVYRTWPCAQQAASSTCCCWGSAPSMHTGCPYSCARASCGLEPTHACRRRPARRCRWR